MATGRQTHTDPAALIAALETAHNALRDALQVTFDHDDQWRLDGPDAATVGYLAGRCREIAATIDRTYNAITDADLKGARR